MPEHERAAIKAAGIAGETIIKKDRQTKRTSMREAVASKYETDKLKGRLLKKQTNRRPKRRAHRRQTKKNGEDDDGPSIPRETMTIAEFCQAHGISVAYYFKLKLAGLGPREMRMTVPDPETRTVKKSGRVMISLEAAADWRREREKASTAAREQAEA